MAETSRLKTNPKTNSPAEQTLTTVRLRDATGSSLGRDGVTLTQVNMLAASYVKFDDISNVALDLRPSRPPPTQPAGDATGASSNSNRPQQQQRRPHLDGSFNVELALGNALDKLQSPQSTPSLGEYPSQQLAICRKCSCLCFCSSATRTLGRRSRNFRKPSRLISRRPVKFISRELAAARG